MNIILELSASNEVVKFLSATTDFELENFRNELDAMKETVLTWATMGNENLNKLFHISYMRHIEIAENSHTLAMTTHRTLTAIEGLSTAIKESFIGYHFMTKARTFLTDSNIEKWQNFCGDLLITCWQHKNSKAFYVDAANRELEFWRLKVDSLKQEKSKASRREEVNNRIQEFAVLHGLDASEINFL